MDKSFNEALTAAAWVYASQDQREPPTPDDIEGTMEDLRSPINAFLDCADLVPRLPEIKQQARLIGERDKARQDRSEAVNLAVMRQRRVAALRRELGRWKGRRAAAYKAWERAIRERDEALARVKELELQMEIQDVPY